MENMREKEEDLFKQLIATYSFADPQPGDFVVVVGGGDDGRFLIK